MLIIGLGEKLSIKVLPSDGLIPRRLGHKQKFRDTFGENALTCQNLLTFLILCEQYSPHHHITVNEAVLKQMISKGFFQVFERAESLREMDYSTVSALKNGVQVSCTEIYVQRTVSLYKLANTVAARDRTCGESMLRKLLKKIRRRKEKVSVHLTVTETFA